MDISSISRHYELKPLTCTPKPATSISNNPRIVLDVKTDRKFNNHDLTSTTNQAYILSVINKQEYHIADLIRGIRASGFISKGDDMIVKRMPRSTQYLVLEGNRRTTAIKHLLNEPNTLKPVVKSTLLKLQVKEFIFKPNREFTEEAVIDILLGTIHITGRLAWGALERAHYIYKSYLRELRKHTKNSAFCYVVECAREVAGFFNMAVRAVRKELIVYRIYEQLQEQEYGVLPHHFTLIDMAVTDRNLSEQYFVLNSDELQFSNRGLARFDRLCIRPKRPINNPKDFRDFAAVYRKGTENEVGLIELNEQPIGVVLDRIRNREGHRELLDQLEEIKRQLKSLQLIAFRGKQGEIDSIREIKRLVDERLLRLTKRLPGNR